jgi:hypothetical protein
VRAPASARGPAAWKSGAWAAGTEAAPAPPATGLPSRHPGPPSRPPCLPQPTVPPPPCKRLGFKPNPTHLQPVDYVLLLRLHALFQRHPVLVEAVHGADKVRHLAGRARAGRVRKGAVLASSPPVAGGATVRKPGGALGRWGWLTLHARPTGRRRTGGAPAKARRTSARRERPRPAPRRPCSCGTLRLPPMTRHPKPSTPARARLPLQLRPLALQRCLLPRQLRDLLLQAVGDVLLLRLELVLEGDLVAVELQGRFQGFGVEGLGVRGERFLPVELPGGFPGFQGSVFSL